MSVKIPMIYLFLLIKIVNKSITRLTTVAGIFICHAFHTSSIFLLAFLCLLNLKLIVISNPSITNPGPKKISVLYNNIQAFVNTRDLTTDSPPLNMTKLHEINGYIFTHAPDIIIMNETWLKPSILNSEILSNSYKVFRLDRSLKPHPFDPDKPKKFRKNGGVLVAHNNDLDIVSKKFCKVNALAEILSVSFKTKCEKTFCLSTFYRVGTLGIDNFNELVRSGSTTLMSFINMSPHWWLLKKRQNIF